MHTYGRNLHNRETVKPTGEVFYTRSGAGGGKKEYTKRESNPPRVLDSIDNRLEGAHVTNTPLVSRGYDFGCFVGDMYPAR